MSRPQHADTKDSRVTIRFQHDDLHKIRLQADLSCMSVSEYIRRCALGVQIVAKSDLRLLGEIRRLGGLLKHIHLETQGRYNTDTRNAIQALESFARELMTKIQSEQAS